GLKTKEEKEKKCSFESHRGGPDGPIRTDGVYAPASWECRALPSPIPVSGPGGSGSGSGSGSGGASGSAKKAPKPPETIRQIRDRWLAEALAIRDDGITCPAAIGWLMSDLRPPGALDAVRKSLQSLERIAWDDNSRAVQEILRGDQNVFSEAGALLDMPCAFAKLARASAIRAGKI